jgi:hypothetical protein
VAALERWDDLGFQHIEVHDLGDRFLCNFEQGLVALSYSGSELWRVSRIMWLWRFYGTRDGLLVFQDQDAEFHLFDSDTGEERAV